MGPELHLLREQRDHSLEPIVGKLRHLTTRRADTMLVRLAGRERLVPLEPLAEVVLLRQAGADQEVERPINRGRPDRDPLGHPPAHLLGRQVLTREEYRFGHRQPLLRRRQVVLRQMAAEFRQKLGTVNFHTTPPAPPPRGARGPRFAQPPPASREQSRPRATAPSPRPRCGTDPAPSRARSACSVPCTRATGRHPSRTPPAFSHAASLRCWPALPPPSPTVSHSTGMFRPASPPPRVRTQTAPAGLPDGAFRSPVAAWVAGRAACIVVFGR